MENELQRLKATRDAYAMKIKAVEEIIEEVSKGVQLMMQRHEEDMLKLSKIENNVKETSRTRRDMLKAMLKETAESYQGMKGNRPKGVEAHLKKQKASIEMMNRILSDLRMDIL